MSIVKFSDLDEVVQRANDTMYGLAAAVWTRDIGKAHAIAHSVRAGTDPPPMVVPVAMENWLHVEAAQRPQRNGFGCRWPIAQGTVWSDRVVLPAAPFDQDLCLGERVEDLPVEEFITQLAVERFDIAVLPRTAGLDEYVSTSSASSHSRTSSAVNSGPLSARMWAGRPCVTKSSANVSSTSVDRILSMVFLDSSVAC